jgi:hypothetical protein
LRPALFGGFVCHADLPDVSPSWFNCHTIKFGKISGITLDSHQRDFSAISSDV